MISARVITCSDAASRGEREDRSGPAVRELLQSRGYAVDAIVIVPDEIDAIANAILDANVRLIVTTGGTGIAARDVTPEATMRVAERVVLGFGERMRASSPKAALSRAQAVTRGATLIVNVPGSVAGATECLGAILDLIPHALQLLAGETKHE
ncbi:MAG TPA: MogA/MoaB family molybdenum cofactor biosynthesis protein [Thermoanaerobaculia bacterium]|nr:MogA/MoaB family molybdenum cofactor biosynthesis protein [Thermoanaerobaculia bacterium]